MIDRFDETEALTGHDAEFPPRGRSAAAMALFEAIAPVRPDRCRSSPSRIHSALPISIGAACDRSSNAEAFGSGYGRVIGF